ncbi:MAG TPA: metallophosphoesterase [Solirubrobacteraceae bacterium]
MLAQVLNRDFMVGVMAATEKELRSLAANREAGVFGKPSELDEIDTAELLELADQIAALRESEEQAPPDGGLEPEQVAEQPPPPKDDYAYLPREPLAGGLQSALETYVREAGVGTKRRELLDDRRSGPEPVVTDELIEGIELQLRPDGRRWFGRMEIAHPKLLMSDPRWLKSVFSMAKRAIHGKAPFVDQPTVVPALAERARILIVGDWGSGVPRAKKVSDQMKAWLAAPDAAGVQKHVIHLGDVYYGGEEDEYVENFLEPWPVPVGSDVASYTLNGNHDMYAGGQAYFATALKNPRFAVQGGSSMFLLANEHWQFLGLDTSYEDAGLHGEQAAWIQQVRRENSGRKTILLSHHQPFSAYEAGAKTLRRKIAPVLDEQPIDGWFWGHEHRCLVYRDLERVRFGSCAGHGGVPEYLSKASPVPPTGLVYEYRKLHSKLWQPWITFGFVVLDVDGPQIRVRYVDEDGDMHYETVLP